MLGSMVSIDILSLIEVVDCDDGSSTISNSSEFEVVVITSASFFLEFEYSNFVSGLASR